MVAGALDAERGGNGAIGVREQGKIETVLCGEGLLSFNGVGADAETKCSHVAEFGSEVAEMTGLRGAAPGHGSWVEQEHDWTVREAVGQTHGVTPLVECLELGQDRPSAVASWLVLSGSGTWSCGVYAWRSRSAAVSMTVSVTSMLPRWRWSEAHGVSLRDPDQFTDLIGDLNASSDIQPVPTEKSVRVAAVEIARGSSVPLLDSCRHSGGGGVSSPVKRTVPTETFRRLWASAET